MGCICSKPVVVDGEVPGPGAAGKGGAFDDSKSVVATGTAMASPFAAVDGLTPTDTLLASRASSLYDTASFDGEEGRVLALRSCAVLDTAPDRRFDIITSLAARLLGVPVCLVSLVDSNRLWFKSVTGPFGTCVAREGSFCSYITVPAAAEMLIVPDATKDARFSGNPFVSGPPDMRFYAGVPLVCSSQHRLGTLCIADFRPRYFSAEAYNLLCNLGEIVVRELERPAVEKRLAEEAAAAAAATADGVSAQLTTPEAAELPAACEPVALFTVSDPSWPLLYGNDAWTTACAAETEEGEEANAKAFWTVFEPINPALDVRLLKKRVNAGRPASVIVRRIGDGAGAGGATFRVKFMLAARDRLDNCVQVGIPGFVSAPGAKEAPEEVEAVQLSELWIATAEALTADGSVNGNSAENCAGTRRFARRAPARGSSALLSASSSSSSASGAAARQNSPPLKPAASLREQLKGRTSLDGLLPSVPPRWANLKLGPLLGQGGFGRVYRGELGEKPVAIKVLEVPRNLVEADRGGSAGTTAKQAVLEAALSVHLAHPSIVPTLDYVVNGGVNGGLEVWIIQHLCDGSLYDGLERGAWRTAPSIDAPPSLPAILSTAHDIASALEYLHDRDILHGDLSGNNVLLAGAANGRGFKALLVDFGLSRGLLTAVHTQTLGTVTHMPPELLLEGTLTKAADSYAFGVILTELWTGRRAWAGRALGYIVYRVTHGGGPEIPTDCPEALKRLIEECLSKDHAARPTASEIVKRLETMKVQLL